jgi:hypothetical protein
MPKPSSQKKGRCIILALVQDAVLGALFNVGNLHVMTKSPEMMKPQNRSLLSCEEALLSSNNYFFSELFGTFAEVITWVKLTPFNTI